MLKGKTALITGSNRGIGKAIVTKFLENGSNFICCGRKTNEEFLNYVNFQNKKNHKIIKVLEFDLENEKQMVEAIKSLHEDKINVDILINNAGIAQGSILEMTSLNNLKRVFEVNYFSQITLIQLLLRQMKKSKNGTIINIGSVSGIKAERGNLSYGSSKAALMFATQVLAKELKNYNIRVNSIAPTVTETDMLKQMDEKAKSNIMNERNLKQPYSADAVAERVLILASDKSKNLNGKIVTMEEKV